MYIYVYKNIVPLSELLNTKFIHIELELELD